MERELELDNRELPPYEMPAVVTYSDEEILDVLGPAQAGYGSTTLVSP